METVLIKITRSTVCGGKSVAKDEVVKASQADARQLISMGKAVPADIQTKADPDPMLADATAAWEESDELQDQFPELADYLEYISQ